MDKNAEEVTRAIAIKLLGGIEGFKLTKLENYKDYIVYFAFPDGVTGEINVGRPIYVLIDKLGRPVYISRSNISLLISSLISPSLLVQNYHLLTMQI